MYTWLESSRTSCLASEGLLTLLIMELLMGQTFAQSLTRNPFY